MSDGLVLANTDNGAITASVYNLPNRAITNLLLRDRQVWIGTEGGLGKINAKLKKSEIPNATASFVYSLNKTTQTAPAAPINTTFVPIPKSTPTMRSRSILNSAQFTCDGRTYCSQMTSCEEAKRFLKYCPNTKLDGNGDGIPCEKQWCK